MAHESLGSKVVLICNSANFFKIHFLKCAKNKLSNKCFHLQKSWLILLVKKKSISNKYKNSIAKTISVRNIYLIWFWYAYPRFQGNVRNICWVDIYLINLVSWDFIPVECCQSYIIYTLREFFINRNVLLATEFVEFLQECGQANKLINFNLVMNERHCKNIVMIHVIWVS